MEKIKSLGLYQKIVVLLLIVMTFVFTIIYSITVSKEGFAYKEAILIPTQENGNTIYSGKIKGESAKFIVSEDKTVEFYYGETLYGPYVAVEDASAIPKDRELLSDSIVGIELYKGEELLFRGGVFEHSDDMWLFNEDGDLENFEILWGTSDGTVVDPMEPAVSEILGLMGNPEMTHKGDLQSWFGGVAICIITAISMLFADELFRWNLSFRIRNVEQAEPSETEMAGRYIAWTVLPIMAMVFYIMGLQYIN